jgi:PKD repeat protein
MVSDTPVHEQANAGCPSFPHNINSQCNPGPNGEMYSNYMDYTDGVCQNIFTQGQVARMNAVLAGTRANLISASNLALTGVDGSGPTNCDPIADFIPFFTKTVCEGGTITFNDKSYNGVVTNRLWTFAGGTPATDTSANPIVTYDTAGVYDVSLTVSNANGSSTKTLTQRVYVFPAGNGVYQPIYNMSFEDVNQFNNDIILLNEDNDTRKWNRVTNTGYNSSSCLKLDNASTPSTGFKDVILTPSFNLQGVTNIKVKFDYSFITKNSSNEDKLQFLVSNNCGQTWIPRWSASGTALAYTTSTQGTPFTPANTSQWKSQTISIPASYAQANTRFKLEFTSGGGNNIYIDNINVDGILAISEINSLQPEALKIFPNPTNGYAQIVFSAAKSMRGSISITDVIGKEIFSIQDMSFMEGENKINLLPAYFNSEGLYFITLKTDQGKLIKKFIIEK